VGGPALRGTDEELRASVLKDLRDYLGLTGDPEWVEIRRYSASMPQYTLGHLDRLKETFERVSKWRGLALAGNGYAGIGLPDCVASGESAAERTFEALQIIESPRERVTL